MIGNDKTVKVTLVAVAQPYVTGLNQASTATKKLGGDIDQVGKRSKGLEGSLSGATTAIKGMAVAGGALAGTALIAFLRGSVEAASDLSETVSKTGEIFGDNTDELREWAQTASTSFGQSERAALDAASTFGVFGKSAGLVDDDLVGFSTSLTELASDMASFANTSPEDAVTALGAALRGESEPIRRYGVLLDEATLRQKALELGIISTTKDALTPQQRVLAAYSEILEQTGTQQGDFARTSDQLANQQRIMAARFEEARASLGEALLPAMTRAVELMIDGVDAASAIIDAFKGIPGPVWAAAAALVAVQVAGPKMAAAALTIRSTMTSAGEALTYAGLAAQRAGGGFAGAAAGLRTFTGQATLAAGAARGLAAAGRGALALVGGPWGAAFIGAAALVGKFMSNQQEAAQRVEELSATLDSQTGAVTENTRAWVVNELQTSGVLETAKRLGLDLELVTDAALGEADAITRLRDALALLEPETTDASDANRVWADGTGALSLDLRNLEGDVLTLAEATGLAGEAALLKAEAMGEDGRAMELSAEAAQAAAGGQRDLAAETEAAAKAAEDAKRALDDYIDSLTAAGMRVLDVRAATREYKRELDESREMAKGLTGAVNESKDAFDLSTEAGFKAEEQLDAQARKAEALADSIYKETQSEAAFRESLAQSRAELQRTAEDFGLSEEAAEAYADQILGIPDSVRTEVVADTMVAATRVIELQRLINGLKDRTITVRVATDTRSVGRVYSGQPVAWDSGGYTGKGARLDPAGIVHKGEFVHTKAELDKPGRFAFHNDLWRTGDIDGAYARYKMRGYASGGLVSSSAAMRSVQAPGGVGIDYGRLAAAMSSPGRSPVQVNIPVQTVERADPVAIGAQVAWQVGGLP